MPFVKLDAGISDSSLWSEDPATCKVFITILSKTNARGICEVTAPGLVRLCNLNLKTVEKSLGILSSPDPHSRGRDEEGRRIVRVDGGYFVVNYLKYREKDYTRAERQRRWRETHNASDGVTRRSVTQAEAEVDVEVPTPLTPQGGNGSVPVKTLHRRKRKKADGLETLDVLGNRVWIDTFNGIMDCKLGFTASNLQAVQRARDHGYTIEQAKQTFQAVFEQSTPSAVWCAKNNWDFEYLIRPPYKNRQTGSVTLGVIDKVLNDLASGRTNAGTTR